MFQHQEILKNSINCPPDCFLPKDIEAYRFVFIDDEDKSFIPVGLMDPKRVKPFGKENNTCLWYSLSMYDSVENASKAFEAFNKNNKVKDKIKKGTSTIGSGLAVAQLKRNHGIMNDPSYAGHFDFFPYKNTIMKELFSLVHKL